MGSGARGSALALVADGVLHLIGKVQPLLIGLNLLDEVESCRQLRVCACCDGVVYPISRHYTRSDRVQCSLTGAVLLNGCNAPSVACSVSSGSDSSAFRRRRFVWFLENVARNFPVNLSGFEFWSLQFQGL